MDLSNLYEKLGEFYLGKEYNTATSKLTDKLFLYDSKDLVTHAVIVGMTGSGKTGLGVTLLEEAAIDKIPSLVIDPKGDLTNLMLNFPDLRPEDLQRWLHADEAQRNELTLEEFAAKKAATWKQGIEDWGQTCDRIRMLGESTDVNIFTPGSDAGLPVSILASFESPPQAVLDDGDLFRDRVSTTATSILTLLGIEADPIRSREHILLTTILDQSWRNSRSMNLGTLIQMVQTPPVQRVGVIDLESFFPSKDRFEFAMAINNLLASPSFASWLSGEPLNIDRLLYTETGKPRTSIFYIAHLSESERMFFLSLLLNQTLGWMRSRPGTNSLRALLYIDEIFGLMPPVAEPPTKKPLLTLLKQARAFGVGVVLATQNPVDLDYKGLSNTGTWFLGRLQTERDKQRVLDGLEGASAESGAGFQRNEMANLLSGIPQRVFLMHNVHEKAPVAFQTRWCLSYLAGPMTRSQIKELMAAKKQTSMPAAPNVTMAPTARTEMPQASTPSGITLSPPSPSSAVATRPVLDPAIRQAYLPFSRSPGTAEIEYQPRLLAMGRVHYVDTRKRLSADEQLLLLASLDDRAFGVDWEHASVCDFDPNEMTDSPPLEGVHAELPSAASQPKQYAAWQKKVSDHVYRTHRYTLYRAPDLDDTYSEPGESERDFRIRLVDRAREKRDEAVAKLREKYASKLRTMEERLRKAEQRYDREREEAKGAKWQGMISMGATVLGAVLGRKIVSSTSVNRAATAARGMSRTRKQEDDVERAQEDVETYEAELKNLEEAVEQETQELSHQFDVHLLEIEEVLLKPRRSDVDIRQVSLVWAPFTRDAAGLSVPLFDVKVST